MPSESGNTFADFENHRVEENTSKPVITLILGANAILSFLLGFILFTWISSWLIFGFLLIYGFTPTFAWCEIVIPYGEITRWNKLMATSFMGLISFVPLIFYLTLQWITKGFFELNHFFRYTWQILRLLTLMWPFLYISTAISGFFSGKGNVYLFFRFLQLNDHLILAITLIAWIIGCVILIFEIPRLLQTSRTVSNLQRHQPKVGLFATIFMFPVGLITLLSIFFNGFQLGHPTIVALISLCSMSLFCFVGLATTLINPQIYLVYKENHLYKPSLLLILSCLAALLSLLYLK